ncbi:hypothetical protein SAMN05428964_106340 [Thalassospira xiamenensis]|uniref:Uncharacterized protein n=1 Tax=Thalassospira xiamenensis TaxID=220697 RepID=A0A285TVS6_9PROT|nr:hypothetical protein SAMN05428964_106340 [Thalassospira xiamenensis]
MAAGGSVELWPVRGEPAGPMSPKCVRASSVTGNVDMAGSDRSGSWVRRPTDGEVGECQRLVRGSLVAGNATMVRRPERAVRSKAVCLRPVGGDAEAPGSSGLPGVREVRFWRRWFAVGAVVGCGVGWGA